jgi:hypothetical protein
VSVRERWKSIRDVNYRCCRNAGMRLVRVPEDVAERTVRRAARSRIMLRLSVLEWQQVQAEEKRSGKQQVIGEQLAEQTPAGSTPAEHAPASSFAAAQS